MLSFSNLSNVLLENHNDPFRNEILHIGLMYLYVQEPFQNLLADGNRLSNNLGKEFNFMF